MFGPDPATLERVGEQIRPVLDEVRGAADLQVEVLSGAAQVQIDVDRSRIARYGLNVADVRDLWRPRSAAPSPPRSSTARAGSTSWSGFPDDRARRPERLGSSC